MPDVTARALRVLIIEDHEPDVQLLLHGLREAEVPHQFIVCENSVEASRHLGRCRTDAAEPLPDLIILDLNLPIWSGLDLLEMLKQDPAFASIPVIVFSSSTASSDIERAYELKAACYLAKPITLAQYAETVDWIRTFWMRTVALPSPAAR